MGEDEINAKIKEIETEMARTQKNKATNYHLGTLKAKLAKLRSELVNGPGGKSAGTKNAERGFDVSKSGDTRVGLGKFVVFKKEGCDDGWDCIALWGFRWWFKYTYVRTVLYYRQLSFYVMEQYNAMQYTAHTYIQWYIYDEWHCNQF